MLIKEKRVKKLNLDWHLIGLLPLAFGILSYIIAIARSVPLWGLLWVCPVTAVAAGMVLLFLPRNRFAISLIVAWIFFGPLMPAIFETVDMLRIHQFHHFMSAVALIVILFHWKDIWNAKGFLFGLASFWAFVIMTLNLSGGVVNLLDPFKKGVLPPMWIGVIFAILSAIIFLWHKPGFKRMRKLKSKDL
ncbi:MAG: hypothetical protein KJ955_06450 [Nanoarchaeota archaeon]|nr:hypothetical protein [Nanoarchaeota archaeon]